MIIAFVAQSCVIAASTITAVPWRAWLWPVRVTNARLRDLLRFGAPVTGEIVLSEGARYWDKPLMLRLLGAHDAGSYGMAFNLAQLPAVYVGGHVGAVMMPAVVRARPDERPVLMVRALAFAALFLFPMAAGLAVCAPTLVATLLPTTWSRVAPLLSVLAIASLPAAGSFILSSFLAAHARNHRLMWIEVATMASLVAALWSLSKGGVLWASTAIGVAALLQWGLTVQACRIDGLRLRGLGLQRLVGRIQFSQQLALLHPRPGIDQPAHQLAADPERQRALLARMHVAGKAQRGVALPRLGLHHPDRTACLRRLLPAATTGQLRPRQQQGQCPGPHQPVHPVHPVHPVFNIELAGMV